MSDRPGARILVVEDEVIIARDLQATLRGLGYDVPEIVASGVDAMKAVDAHPPDLVLMDVHLQGDIDGIEAAAHIQRAHGTPVIYLTSFSDEGTIARAKPTGAYGYLLKPFRDRDLRTAIEVALEKRSLELTLYRSEQVYRAIVQNMPSGAVFLVDRDLRFAAADGPAVAHFMRRTKVDDLVGRSVLEVVSDANSEHVLDLFRGVLRGERRHLEIERDGRFFDVKAVPIFEGELVSHALLFLYDVTTRKIELAELEQSRAALEQQAVTLRKASSTDELTGLLNRRGFMLLAEQELRLARRNKGKLVLVFIDINGMKTINDKHGHEMGDRALVETGSLLRRVFRDSDVVARLGGDEFVVLATHAAETSGTTFAVRLKAALAEFNRGAQPFRLSLSAGTSVYDPAEPLTLDALLSNADARMYDEKNTRPSGMIRINL